MKRKEKLRSVSYPIKFLSGRVSYTEMKNYPLPHLNIYMFRYTKKKDF